MSFTVQVEDLTLLGVGPHGSNSRYLPWGDMSTGGTPYTCPDWQGMPYPCMSNAVEVHNFSRALADIDFNTGADYFAVLAWLEGPSLTGQAGCHVQITSVDNPPCGDPAEAYAAYDGVVSGDWVNQVVVGSTTSAVAQDPTFSVGPVFGDPALAYWPSAAGSDDAAYLVNPSPTWPVPDSEGNTFGQCLFTLAQLPASVDVEIVHDNLGSLNTGRLWVAVLAYTGEPPEEPTARRGCVVGAA